ncbi:DUF4870 domain-containing protein [Mucilaginibacter calamicampi]|uniref:DUF4870 domain-containing protein n=1 Tax=Mucilaginibacter calamicampi TaxID=1302352 RepID=A0ABW2YR73_9SPHI
MKTGEFIRELRLKKGMTQEDLAAKTDVSARTIQRIENSEVDARAYTLQSIAAALEVDFETLNSVGNTCAPQPQINKGRIWLPLLHLSGLGNLLVPPLLIWVVKRNSVDKMREHGTAVLNFQLSILLYEMLAVTPAIFIPSVIFIKVTLLLIILNLFSAAVILINTLKVINGQHYKYPLSINILKST